MKTEIKIMRDAIKEKNNRLFLTTLGLLKKEDFEYFDEQTGFNIIHYCVKENACKELQLILSHIPHINLALKSQGIIQKSPLEIAFSHQHNEISRILIQAGASFDIREMKKRFKNDYKLNELMNEMNAKQAKIELEKYEKIDSALTKKKRFFSFL